MLIQEILSETMSGGIAIVAQPMGKVIKRPNPSVFGTTKTKKKKLPEGEERTEIEQAAIIWLNDALLNDYEDNLNSDKMSIVRDRALIAVMTGCGLRRFEISDLKITQMKQVQGRWAFTDIKGKGERYRTVAIPEYAVKCLEECRPMGGCLCMQYAHIYSC